MRVHLRYFARMREDLGRAEETREISPGTTVSALVDTLVAENPSLAGLAPALMVMVNEDYVTPGQTLADGDEIAIVPPVSGGAGDGDTREGRDGPARFAVVADPLDPRLVEGLVASAAAGALVTFTGSVRDYARGQTVSALDYEAYAPAAVKMLARIGDEIGERWGIDRVAIWHRTGLLGIGEASVVIAVASAHREEAFAACQYAIERLKQIVPIWKKEHYVDGAVWIGSEADYPRGRPVIAPPAADSAH